MNAAAAMAPPIDTTRTEIVEGDRVPTGWAPAWDALAKDASEPNPFAERWFMAPALAHLNRPEGLRLIAIWSGREMLGLAALHIAANYGRTPLRHVTNWLHYHSFYGSPLIRRGHETAFWTALLAALDASDWAPNFLHLSTLDPGGATLAALNAVRRADVVHTSERAMLASDLTAQRYYETHMRKKKRKEIGRLVTRLGELGMVTYDRLPSATDPADWINAFLALEASGWKGREGSALATDPQTHAFVTEALTGAHAAGRLEMIRLSLDHQPIAMLVNFITPPGSYSFKIAFDEDYARFSPGVLIQIENLKLLDGDGVAWMDSCAVEDHPMINSLWAERRPIVRVTVPLRGLKRRAAFSGARALESASALVRRLT